MCLHVSLEDHVVPKGKRRPQPLIAKKRIEVFKKLYVTSDRRLLSPYKSYEYALNEVVRSPLKMESGFHWAGGYEINRGLHAYRTQAKAKSRCNCYEEIVLRAYIPKGAKYFIGIHQDIASDQLVVTKKKVCGQPRIGATKK